MNNYEFISLLKEKKILDSYQFVSSCRFKLVSAEMSFKALTNIWNEHSSMIDEKIDSAINEARLNGAGEIKSVEDKIYYFGENIERSLLIDKLVIEIFSTLHSFFDTYAQLINSSLFANNAISISRVTFNSVVNKLNAFPEYNGNFITKLKNVTLETEYQFISDINNTIKHRYQIFTKARLNLLNGDKSILIPKFRKGANNYSEKNAIDIISDCFIYCKTLYDDLIDFIINHYTINNNNYVSNRLYNPLTFLVFDNADDAKQMKNPINSTYYVELDKNNLELEYGILLVSDDRESIKYFV